MVINHINEYRSIRIIRDINNSFLAKFRLNVTYLNGYLFNFCIKKRNVFEHYLYRVAPQKTEQSIFQDFALINNYLFSLFAG